MIDKNLLPVTQVLALLTAMSVFFLILVLGSDKPGRKVLHAYMELKGFLAKKSRNSSWYSRTDDWLRKKGADYHFGAWMKPAVWLGLRLLLGMAGVLAGMQFSTVAGVLGAFLGYGLPSILVRYLNRRDNDRMLPEIRLIYHALEIQIRAGVYVADALTECYAGVQERRLRKALLDLAGAVTMQADIYDALEQFQGKFDNRYIDALCVTVIQALESGQALELLGDIAEQVKDMEVAVLERKKGALDRSVTFYQLGILAAMLGIVLYACVMQMFTAALSF